MLQAEQEQVLTFRLTTPHSLTVRLNRYEYNPSSSLHVYCMRHVYFILLSLFNAIVLCLCSSHRSSLASKAPLKFRLSHVDATSAVI